jgi:phospholipid/cholesterol/gamma-HCH transport system ATP-binding protein
MNRPPRPETVIKVRGLRNGFGDHLVHDGLDLEVRRGEIIGVVGGSGTGKSVLMRSVIGLQTPLSGEIEVFGESTIGRDETEATEIRKRWGILFQGGALFSTLTVAENVQVPLKEFYPALDQQLLDEIAGYKVLMSGLPPEAGPKYPSELSGGMKKRAGLARAIALDPKILFYDEPSAGLDPVTSAEIDQLIIDLNRKLQVTSVVVTHEMDSAFRIAHRMVLLDRGKFVVSGTPQEMRDSTDPLVRQFVDGLTEGPLTDRRRAGGYEDDLLATPYESQGAD